MDGPQTIIAAVVVALVLLGGGIGVQYSMQEAGTQHNYTEEFDTGTVGSTVTFNESNIDRVYYTERVTVTNESGENMLEGDDFEWYQENGTLKVSSSDLANNVNAQIDYSLRNPTDSQHTFATILGNIYQSGAYIPMLVILALVFLAIGTLGALT